MEVPTVPSQLLAAVIGSGETVAAPWWVPPNQKAGTSRKSCDLCGRRKRKCDGGNPCGFCKRKGSVCHYSKRLSTAPRRENSQDTAAAGSGGSGSGGSGSGGSSHGVSGISDAARSTKRPRPLEAVDPAAFSADSSAGAAVPPVAGAGGGSSSGASSNGSSSGSGGSGAAPQPYQLMTLQRCSLRASPATGLVGMQENRFLSSFFEAMGFMALASESNIRTTLVDLVFNGRPAMPGAAFDASAAVANGIIVPDSALSSRFGAGSPNFGGFAAFGGSSSSLDSADGSDGAAESGLQELAAYDGRSATSGGTRSEFAALVLANKEREAHQSVLWSTIAIGAAVQGCDVERVLPYVDLARQALGGCFDSESPEVARAYILIAILHDFIGEDTKFLRYLKFAETILASLPDARTPEDIKDILRFARLVRLYSYGTDDERRALAMEEPEEVQLNDILREKDLFKIVISVEREVCKSFHRDLLSEEQGPDADPLPQATDRCRDLVSLMEGLNRATRESADINRSAGGLCVRSLYSYMTFLLGDLDRSIGALRSSVELLSRYPGLMRFNAWKHFAHAMLCAFAVVEEAADCYPTMRDAYNCLRIPGYRMPHRLEDLRADEVCPQIFCRHTCTAIGKRYAAFKARKAAEGADCECAGGLPAEVPAAGVPAAGGSSGGGSGGGGGGGRTSSFSDNAAAAGYDGGFDGFGAEPWMAAAIAASGNDDLMDETTDESASNSGSGSNRDVGGFAYAAGSGGGNGGSGSGGGGAAAVLGRTISPGVESSFVFGGLEDSTDSVLCRLWEASGEEDLSRLFD